jgi:hypothetical protein
MGPKGRFDEFAELRHWELAGIFHHSDLWLEYTNEFENVKSDWTKMGNDLIRSMEIVIATIQLLNENVILPASIIWRGGR